jgi:HAMP domain-containing protein
MRLSIGTKLLILMLVLAIVPLAVVGILAYNNLSSMEDTAVDRVDNMTDTAVSNSTTALEELGEFQVWDKAEATAKQVEIYITKSATTPTKADLQGDTYLIFENPTDESPLYAGVHYGDDDSDVLDLAGPLAIAEGGEWNRFADENGDVIDLTGMTLMNVSETPPVVGTITSNTKSTVSATPAAGSFDWDSGDEYFWDIAIQDVAEEGGGYTVLVEVPTGSPICHPSPRVVNLPESVGRGMFPDIYDVMDECIDTGEPCDGTFPFAETADAEAKDRYSVFYPVKDEDGNYIETADGTTFMVSTARYVEEFNAPALAIENQLNTQRDAVASDLTDAKNDNQLILWITLAASVVVVAIVALLFARTLTSPIKKLRTAADKISQGDTTATIDIKSKDEIGDLAESFERMSASLKIMMQEKGPEGQ